MPRACADATAGLVILGSPRPSCVWFRADLGDFDDIPPVVASDL